MTEAKSCGNSTSLTVMQENGPGEHCRRMMKDNGDCIMIALTCTRRALAIFCARLRGTPVVQVGVICGLIDVLIGYLMGYLSLGIYHKLADEGRSVII